MHIHLPSAVVLVVELYFSPPCGTLSALSIPSSRSGTCRFRGNNAPFRAVFNGAEKRAADVGRVAACMATIRHAEDMAILTPYNMRPRYCYH